MANKFVDRYKFEYLIKVNIFQEIHTYQIFANTEKQMIFFVSKILSKLYRRDWRTILFLFKNNKASYVVYRQTPTEELKNNDKQLYLFK